MFQYMEGEREEDLHKKQRAFVLEMKSQLISRLSDSNALLNVDDELRWYLKNMSLHQISLENYLILSDSKLSVPRRWTFESSVLFAFTILTTIGYGNLAPTSHECQIFTMMYGAFGIPLFLITIADLGRFSKTGIMTIIQLIYKKELKRQGEQRFWREIGEVFLVAVVFISFIACGSAILPMWENQLSYFDSVYFSYMSLTTIGLGDIVPRRMDFLLPTLIYITIGLWLTTVLVEQLADVFRLVHYAGRQVTNVKGISVWLGGRRLSVGGLISTVCRRVGMSENLINQINWDKAIDQAFEGRDQPISLFPWHFADFLDNDPPLIDLSIDLDQWEAQGSFYLSGSDAPPAPPVQESQQKDL
ncbi:unnamed protein product [Auanema sp. JU1783]|nr:unnamed protein product [Auanema sp. JU1783]